MEKEELHVRASPVPVSPGFRRLMMSAFVGVLLLVVAGVLAYVFTLLIAVSSLAGGSRGDAGMLISSLVILPLAIWYISRTSVRLANRFLPTDSAAYRMVLFIHPSVLIPLVTGIVFMRVGSVLYVLVGSAIIVVGCTAAYVPVWQCTSSRHLLPRCKDRVLEHRFARSAVEHRPIPPKVICWTAKASYAIVMLLFIARVICTPFTLGPWRLESVPSLRLVLYYPLIAALVLLLIAKALRPDCLRRSQTVSALFCGSLVIWAWVIALP